MIITESPWYLAALFGEKPPLHDDSPPEPGWYKRRLIARGPFVPARVWCEENRDDDGELTEDVRYYCEVNGSLVNAFDEWWLICKYPISRDEWEMMDGLRKAEGAVSPEPDFMAGADGQ